MAPPKKLKAATPSEAEKLTDGLDGHSESNGTGLAGKENLTQSPGNLESESENQFSHNRVDALAREILFQLISQRHGGYELASTVKMAFDYATEFEKQRITARGELK